MNTNTDLEQVLRVHFDNQADPSARDGQLDRIIDRLAAVRQRPGWTILERWLPMSAISSRFAAAPRLPLRVLVVALLVLALAVSVILVAGALRHAVPPPFGPAVNGLIAYTDARGAIDVGDPISGASREIVPGTGNSRPIFSPDGTRIVFLTVRTPGHFDAVVVRPDGTGATTITAEPLGSVSHLGWTPDSASVVIGDSSGGLGVYDSTRAAPPTSLGTTAGADDYNPQVADLYQPPAGQQVLLLRPAAPRPALILANRDGSNERPLIDASRSDYAFIYLGAAQWSPEGSKISFVGATRDVAEDYITYVMNADGTDLHPLSKSTVAINESNPSWSPDGTRIALQRWLVDVSAHTQEVRPITVVDVKTGIGTEVGDPPANGQNGFTGWGWSPDGESIIELSPNAQVIIINVATGKARTLPWSISSAAAWQRTAP